jgi:FkbM family methyltransferase
MDQAIQIQSADCGTNINATLQTDNGWLVLPSSLRHADDAPRFKLNFPLFYLSDAGAAQLIAHETNGGYEPPTRNLFERVLRPGDLFVDIGAHWGFFALQAATHPAGGIDVVAFEPELMNAVVLTENVTRNKLANVTVVCAACGDERGLAALVTNSTMRHCIVGADSRFDGRVPSKWVSLVTLDRALADLHKDGARRIIVKIDAEGFEPNIVAGAAALLKSGRVALVMWEYSGAFFAGPRRAALLAMIGFLGECGFRHVRPAANDGALLELFEPERRSEGNVFSFLPPLDIGAGWSGAQRTQ